MIRRLLPYGLVFVAFLAIYLLTAAGHIWNTDGWTRYMVAVGLVEYGRPVLPPEILPSLGSYWIVHGPGGTAYSYFGIGQSLAFVPLHVAGLGVQALAHGASDWPAVLASFLNSFVGASLAVAVFALARQLGHGQRVALGAAGLCGLGTIVWDHSRDSYDLLIETLCLTACLAILLFAHRQGSKRAIFAAALVFGCGALARFSVAFALPGVILLVARGDRLRSGGTRCLDLFRFGAGLVPAVAVILWYDWLRFGQPFSTGYEGKAPRWFESSVGAGLATFLVSPGRGLLWYVPLAIAVPFLARRTIQRAPAFAASLCVISIAYLLAYSQFGGLGLWGWGPHYLLPLMPLIAVVWAEALESWRAFPRRARIALAGLVVVSVSIQAFSVSAAWLRTYVRATVAHADFGRALDWQPEWSLLLNQGGNVLNAARHLRPGTQLEHMRGPANHQDRLLRDVELNAPDWWWIRALYRGIRWAALVPAVLVAILAGSLGLLLRRTIEPRASPRTPRSG